MVLPQLDYFLYFFFFSQEDYYPNWKKIVTTWLKMLNQKLLLEAHRVHII